MKSFLTELAERRGWDDVTPITERQKPPQREPHCHCPPSPRQSVLGGQEPRLDLEGKVIRCNTCKRVIPASCKRRQVVWLRRLLELPAEQFDAASVAELLYVTPRP